MRNALVAAALVGLSLSTGCVMPDQLAQIQKDLADVRQQLQRVKTEQVEARATLAELSSRAPDQETVQRSELADVQVRLDQLEREFAAADERMGDLSRRLERASRDYTQSRERVERAALPRPPAPGEGEPPEGDEQQPGDAAAGGPAVPAIPDPDALYNTAYTDFSKGNYALAISGFEEYYDQFPDSSLADNALYWVGECHFSQGNFPEAVRALDRMLERFPTSDRAAAGNLKKALAYLEQNQISQAIIQLRYVLSTYAGSDEAKIARDKLSSLGASPT